MNIANKVLERAKAFGDLVALSDSAGEIKYSQLEKRVSAARSRLAKGGVRAGDRVGVILHDSVDTAVQLLAILSCEATLIPINEIEHAIEVREQLNHVNVRYLVVDSEFRDALETFQGELSGLRGIFYTDNKTMSEVAQPPEESGSAAAFVLYAAGGVARGIPGIVHRHETPWEVFKAHGESLFEYESADRLLCLQRLSTWTGIGPGLLFPLWAGAHVHFVGGQPKSSKIFAAARSFAPTKLLVTPSLASQLARDAQQAEDLEVFSSVEKTFCSGESLPAHILPRIRKYVSTSLVVGYGLTEAFAFAMAGKADEIPAGSCGKLAPGVEARLVGEEGEEVEINEIGTLEIRAPFVTGQDTHDDKLGAALNEDGWFRTQDRFMKDAGGHYFFSGRADDLIKVSGKWVAPAEVERVLLAHEAVWECAIVGIPDDDGMTKPLAFVVPNLGHAPSEDLGAQLRDFVKAQMAPYKYPRWVEFVDSLPRGPTGKLLRFKLKPKRVPREAEKPNS